MWWNGFEEEERKAFCEEGENTGLSLALPPGCLQRSILSPGLLEGCHRSSHLVQTSALLLCVFDFEPIWLIKKMMIGVTGR